MQDIVPKKSIREITKPRAPHRADTATTQPDYKDIDSKKPVASKPLQSEEYPHTRFESVREGKSKGRLFILLLCFLFIGTGLYLHMQKSATVYITQKKHTLTFKDADIQIPLSEMSVLTVSTTTIITIKTSTGTPVLTKAKGTVTIYNGNSTEQVLIANTRLETPKGKIYRLDSTITVPKSGVSGIPGSIQAAVTADKTGESYNVTQTDFTFPGLIGSPRYKNVYARTKNAISGGKEASSRIVDAKDKDAKIALFKEDKKIALEKEIASQTNNDALSIQKPTITDTFEKTSDTQGTVTLKITESIIDAKKFATILAKKEIQNVTNTMEFVGDTSGLNVEYVSQDNGVAQVKINGVVTVKEYLDVEVLKTTLAEKPFNQFRELIQQFEGIQESRFTSKPFWISSFPQNSRIFIDQK